VREDHTLEHLEEWLRPQPVEVGDAFARVSAHTSAHTRLDPLGTVLVIALWNFRCAHRGEAAQCDSPAPLLVRPPAEQLSRLAAPGG
jgi:hypothetical protein